MNKIITIFYALGIIALSFASCSQTDDEYIVSVLTANRSAENITTLAPDTTNYVTPLKAMEMAAILATINSSSRSSDYRVAEGVEGINDDSGNTIMYVVNYSNNQGFAIISASKDYYPILAESEIGHFDINSIGPDHPLNVWIEQQSYVSTNADYIIDEKKKDIASAWMPYNTITAHIASTTDKPQVYYDSLRVWSISPNIEVYTYEDYIQTQEYLNLSEDEKRSIFQQLHTLGNSNYGSIESSTLVLRESSFEEIKRTPGQSVPSRDIKWGQKKGFNDAIPLNLTYPDSLPIGCTAVAVGQIMRVLKYPSYYSWQQMPFSNATVATAEFLYDVGRTIGINYAAGSSSGDIIKVKKAFEAFGYEVTEITPNEARAISEMINDHPMYMEGKPNKSKKGHAWVCDGIHRRTHSTAIRFMTLEYRPTTTVDPPMIEAYKIDNNTHDTKFYFNWGEYGNDNGFYLYSDPGYINSSTGQVNDYSFDRRDLIIRKGSSIYNQ